MTTVSITIEDAEARRRLGQLAADLSPGPAKRAFLNVLGREAARQLRRHFLGRNADSPNKQGWKRQNFWSRIRSATAHDEALTTDDEAVVVIADPALKGHLYGGTWGARTSKYLAIPIHERAYGKRPSSGQIAGLKFQPAMRAGNVAGWLYAETKGGERTYYYRLQKTVTLSRDPRALPEAGVVGAALVRAGLGHLRRGGSAG